MKNVLLISFVIFNYSWSVTAAPGQEEKEISRDYVNAQLIAMRRGFLINGEFPDEIINNLQALPENIESHDAKSRFTDIFKNAVIAEIAAVCERNKENLTSQEEKNHIDEYWSYLSAGMKCWVFSDEIVNQVLQLTQEFKKGSIKTEDYKKGIRKALEEEVERDEKLWAEGAAEKFLGNCKLV